MKIYLKLFLACLVVIAFFLLGNWSQQSPEPKQASADSAASTVKDPVCGMDVDRAKAEAAGRKSEYLKKTYYFCSDYCKKQFDKDPAKYLKEKSDSARSAAQHIDPICGMKVGPASALFTSEYLGKTYYFCNENCKRAFDADPGKYQGKT